MEKVCDRPVHTLLTWHSQRAGAAVLENALHCLAKTKKIHIREIYYLCQTKIDKPNMSGGIDYKPVYVDLKDPTAHDEIYVLMKNKVLPKVHECSHLHINISPGTPAMHAIWLLLHAGGSFPMNTRLWSSQYDQVHKTTRISDVKFEINTYLAAIRAEVHRHPDLALYDPESLSKTRRKALQTLSRYALVPHAPLFILGERGIGKTRLVETLVAKLKNKSKVITVACGTLDSELAESSLFGHIKGAFTGANNDRKGLLKEADKGILFLDEVQDLPKPLQRKLVRVFQDRQHRFRSVGSDKETSTDIEVVCASNQSLEKLRDLLDADLFDRLAHLLITIPPLRLCREDIKQDWQQAWDELRHKEMPQQAPYSDRLEALFLQHDFPGNFRDLQGIFAI